MFGTVAKRIFYHAVEDKPTPINNRIYRITRGQVHLDTMEKEQRISFNDILHFFVGIIGGVGTHYLQKSRKDKGGLIGSIAIGAVNDSINSNKGKKLRSMLIGNLLYGFITNLTNLKLKDWFLNNDPLEEYLEEMKQREEKEDIGAKPLTKSKVVFKKRRIS